MVSRDQIVSQAQVIFREVLDSPELVLTDELTAPKVAGWDSLNAQRRPDARLSAGEAEQIAGAG
jgi:hypothetical protein